MMTSTRRNQVNPQQDVRHGNCHPEFWSDQKWLEIAGQILYKCHLCIVVPMVMTSKQSFLDHVHHAHVKHQDCNKLNICSKCSLCFLTEEDLAQHTKICLVEMNLHCHSPTPLLKQCSLTGSSKRKRSKPVHIDNAKFTHELDQENPDSLDGLSEDDIRSPCQKSISSISPSKSGASRLKPNLVSVLRPELKTSANSTENRAFSLLRNQLEGCVKPVKLDKNSNIIEVKEEPVDSLECINTSTSDSRIASTELNKLEISKDLVWCTFCNANLPSITDFTHHYMEYHHAQEGANGGDVHFRAMWLKANLPNLVYASRKGSISRDDLLERLSSEVKTNDSGLWGAVCNRVVRELFPNSLALRKGKYKRTKYFGVQYIDDPPARDSEEEEELAHCQSESTISETSSTREIERMSSIISKIARWTGQLSNSVTREALLQEMCNHVTDDDAVDVTIWQQVCNKVVRRNFPSAVIRRKGKHRTTVYYAIELLQESKSKPDGPLAKLLKETKSKKNNKIKNSPPKAGPPVVNALDLLDAHKPTLLEPITLIPIHPSSLSNPSDEPKVIWTIQNRSSISMKDGASMHYAEHEIKEPSKTMDHMPLNLSLPSVKDSKVTSHPAEGPHEVLDLSVKPNDSSREQISPLCLKKELESPLPWHQPTIEQPVFHGHILPNTIPPKKAQQSLQKIAHKNDKCDLAQGLNSALESISDITASIAKKKTSVTSRSSLPKAKSILIKHFQTKSLKSKRLVEGSSKTLRNIMETNGGKSNNRKKNDLQSQHIVRKGLNIGLPTVGDDNLEINILLHPGPVVTTRNFSRRFQRLIPRIDKVVIAMKNLEKLGLGKLIPLKNFRSKIFYKPFLTDEVKEGLSSLGINEDAYRLMFKKRDTKLDDSKHDILMKRHPQANLLHLMYKP